MSVPSTSRRRKKAENKPEETLPPPAKNDWRAQEYTIVPIDSISPRSEDEDPNRGDTDAIGESIDENGFFGAIYVRRADRKIIAGKTRWGQLKAQGSPDCPVIFLDVDETRADAINIADNRTRDHAKTNDRVLADMVARIKVRVPTLKGLGIRAPDVSSLLAKALPRVGYLDSVMREDAEEAADEPEADADEEHDATDFEEEGDPDEGPEEAEAAEAGAPEDDLPEFPRHEEQRHALPIVLTNAEMRRWTEYKKRIGERKDKAAFLVLLAAAMGEDDGDAASRG